MNRRFASLLVTALFVVAIAASQTPPGRKSPGKALPSTAFKLISVQVKGVHRYQQSQVVAAAGLELGQTVSEDDFKRAVQRLGDTGAFTELAYSFQYSPEGTKLELQISENEQKVPARFDNLVWFSDQELLGKLQARVPLYQGQLPLSGNLIDQVSQALQSLLDERNVQGKIDYLRAGRQGGPLEAIAFTVSGPKITIRNSEFPGAAPAELPLLEAAARKRGDNEYLRSMLRAQEDLNFLPVYLSRGYLKASFGDAQAKVAKDTPDETLVDVAFPVEPGRQYKIAEVRWVGNSVFPAEKLQPFLHLPAGQPANAVQLADDLESAKKLYGTRGYLAAGIRPAPEFNDEASTVSYQLKVHEGELYHMGDLEIRGLDSRTTARLVEQWKLHAEDVFDDSYPKKFLDEAYKDPALRGWTANSRQSMNEADKTVDVSFTFEADRK